MDRLEIKDIKGYDGRYAITTDGRIWSYKAKKYLKERVNETGYTSVCLSKNGQAKSFYVHRLVAETYIPNPENKPQVNHKDENRSNNNVNNLEWTTAKENSNYGTRNSKISLAKAKPVKCIETNRVFVSMTAAALLTGAQCSKISQVCKGKRKTAGGYHWEYWNFRNPKRGVRNG